MKTKLLASIVVAATAFSGLHAPAYADEAPNSDTAVVAPAAGAEDSEAPGSEEPAPAAPLSLIHI